jgi:hypothetical protein
LRIAIPLLPTVTSPLKTPGFRVTVPLEMVCPEKSGSPVVDGPDRAANGSAVAVAPTVGAGDIRPATVPDTLPVTRWYVPVSSPPDAMLTALLLVELVADPPPTMVRSAPPARFSAPDDEELRTTTASPSPDLAIPATDRTETAVRPPVAPRRKAVLTSRLTVTSIDPGSPAATPSVGGEAVVIVVSASAA